MVLKPQILHVHPQVGIPGGEVIVHCQDFDTSNFTQCQAFIGSTRARIISASTTRVVIGIPEISNDDDLSAGIRLKANQQESNVAAFQAGALLASDLHPVANPAFDPDSGNIYTTLSGARGKKVEVSVWKISSSGKVSKFLSDIINPTGLAFDQEGTLYISSRYDGNVYRVSPFSESEAFVRDLGVATGIIFNRKGELFVGDRQGIIYRIDGLGKAHKFAMLEPSVAAYHLAFSPNGNLYVTGPTTGGSREVISEITPDGEVKPFHIGLGRPQGLAFDTDGNLYVAASLDGLRGIFKIPATGGSPERVLAGNNLVGLAFDDQGHVLLTTTGEVYRAPLGVKGYMPWLDEDDNVTG